MALQEKCGCMMAYELVIIFTLCNLLCFRIQSSEYSIGYLSFTKDHTKLDLLQILALVLLLSKLLTSCLTVIKSHVIRYCETVYETSNKN